MNRNNLIALSLKYEGEYAKITKAIEREEIIDLNEDVDCITLFDENYPKQLLDLRFPPYVLYYKGDIGLLNEKFEAVVGTRMPSDYSSKITKEYCKGKNVINGLAKGICTTACENASKFIGVLGCGIDYIYPQENYDLFKKADLLISEYPHLVKPLAYHFAVRNRIIVALCSKLTIMEAKHKKVATSWVDEALEINRDISVLPFAIDNDEEICNNELINNGVSVILKV